MKRNIIIVLLASAGIFGCKDFVQEIDPPIDRVQDHFLNDESQTRFVVNGVLAQFYDAYGQLSCLGDGLGDELIFDDRAPNATYPNYRLIDQGNPEIVDVSIEDAEL